MRCENCKYFHDVYALIPCASFWGIYVAGARVFTAIQVHRSFYNTPVPSGTGKLGKSTGQTRAEHALGLT